MRPVIMALALFAVSCVSEIVSVDVSADAYAGDDDVMDVPARVETREAVDGIVEQCSETLHLLDEYEAADR